MLSGVAALISGGLNIASTLANTYADWYEANEAYQMQIQKWKDENAERRKDYMLQSIMLDQQSQEVDTQSASEVLERKLQAQKESARIRAAAGSSGIEGNVIGRMLVDVEQSLGRDTGTSEYNREIKQGQIYNERRVAFERSKPQKLYATKPNRRMAMLRMGIGIAGAVGKTAGQWGQTGK